MKTPEVDYWSQKETLLACFIIIIIIILRGSCDLYRPNDQNHVGQLVRRKCEGVLDVFPSRRRCVAMLDQEMSWRLRRGLGCGG